MYVYIYIYIYNVYDTYAETDGPAITITQLSDDNLFLHPLPTQLMVLSFQTVSLLLRKRATSFTIAIMLNSHDNQACTSSFIFHFQAKE